MYRIATWNLDRPSEKRRSLEAQQRRIAEIGADLWVLTETGRNVELAGMASHATRRPLLESYADEEAYAAIHHHKSLQPRSWATFDDRFAVCLIFDPSPLGPMIVYGSIITYWKDTHGGARTWENHLKSIEQHGQDWRNLSRAFPNHTLVVAGDYNQHLDGRGQHTTKECDAALRAAFKQADLVCLTDRDYSSELDGRHNIDHIAISVSAQKRWRIRSDVWKRQPDGCPVLSDHNATSITLEPLE